MSSYEQHRADHDGGVEPTQPIPSVLSRILDSLGFRFGLVGIIVGFAAGALGVRSLLPTEDLETIAAALVVFTLTPAAVLLWMAVGILAPPAPFRAGALLGLLGALFLSILAILDVDDVGFGFADSELVDHLFFGVIMSIGASLTTGIVGWVVRRVFMGPEARRPFRDSPGLESRSRPRPSLVIAVAYVSLALLVPIVEIGEWLVVAVFAAVTTAALVAWGLDVQRRYPDRRTPVVVVGLIAGLVAGLAMLQAIWAEGRWPQRRRSSDALAIAVSAFVVVVATWTAYGEPRIEGPGFRFGGRILVVEPADDAEVPEADVDLSRDILGRRLEALGIDARVRIHDDKLRISVPSDADAALVEHVLGGVGLLEFTPVALACAPEVIQDVEQPLCLDETEPLFTGTEIDAARIGQDQTTGEIVVNLELKDTGARLFDEHAEAHYGEQFAIVLDGIVESAPSINATRFGGQAQISGNFALDEAQNLVTVLKFGSLPLEIREVGFSSISATLGLDFLEQTILAGIIGIALVFAFMLLYYRVPGMVACVALVFYGVFAWAIFQLVPVTLTLAGIAAFILSVGMAVDANILIFERTKEELRSGKMLTAAVEAGFNRAWTSIFDANISTLITAGILYYFGTSVVKGFALVLGIGVLLSMFTAIVLSRMMLRWIVQQRWAKQAHLFGIADSQISIDARSNREVTS